MQEDFQVIEGINFPLHGVPIIVNETLIGSKVAIYMQDGVHVSPAMFDLMKNSEGDELNSVIKAIQVIDLRNVDTMDFIGKSSWGNYEIG